MSLFRKPVVFVNKLPDDDTNPVYRMPTEDDARAYFGKPAMTPEERAAGVLNDSSPYKFTGGQLTLVTRVGEHLGQQITRAIREAEAAMKERCAKVADHCWEADNGDVRGITNPAAAIRALE